MCFDIIRTVHVYYIPLYYCFDLYLASQMWLLGRVLPLIIGDYVPDDDEHWLLFLCLMEVVDLLFAPKLTKDHVAYLSTLISDHHHDFSRLYSSHPIIPKMHFMVHMP